jgi:hypothetical protein
VQPLHTYTNVNSALGYLVEQSNGRLHIGTTGLFSSRGAKLLCKPFEDLMYGTVTQWKETSRLWQGRDYEVPMHHIVGIRILIDQDGGRAVYGTR